MLPEKELKTLYHSVNLIEDLQVPPQCRTKLEKNWFWYWSLEKSNARMAQLSSLISVIANSIGNTNCQRKDFFSYVVQTPAIPKKYRSHIQNI